MNTERLRTENTIICRFFKPYVPSPLNGLSFVYSLKIRFAKKTIYQPMDHSSFGFGSLRYLFEYLELKFEALLTNELSLNKAKLERFDVFVNSVIESQGA